MWLFVIMLILNIKKLQKYWLKECMAPLCMCDHVEVLQHWLTINLKVSEVVLSEWAFHSSRNPLVVHLSAISPLFLSCISSDWRHCSSSKLILKNVCFSLSSLHQMQQVKRPSKGEERLLWYHTSDFQTHLETKLMCINLRILLNQFFGGLILFWNSPHIIDYVGR